jgi:hypothetical protein
MIRGHSCKYMFTYKKIVLKTTILDIILYKLVVVKIHGELFREKKIKPKTVDAKHFS